MELTEQEKSDILSQRRSEVETHYRYLCHAIIQGNRYEVDQHRARWLKAWIKFWDAAREIYPKLAGAFTMEEKV